MAALGHAVVLVEREPFPRPRVGESLLPAIVPLLDVLGIRREVESAAFLRPRGTLLQWAGAMEYRRSSPDAGFQVDRGRFDAIVLDAARAAGARVLQPARARRPTRHGDGWRTAVSAEGGITVASRLVADCSGRSGWLRQTRRRSAPRTLALYAYWRDVPLPGPETRVEAGDAHWYWGAPLPDGLFNAAVFVDRSIAAPAIRAGGADRFYEHLVARSSLLAQCRRGQRAGGVRVCEATPSQVDTPITTDAISIGEAAFSIDPLSSQGVQSALGSALHAAAAVHTIVERPADAALGIAFYRQAQRDAAAFHARAAGRAYREALERWPGAFWQSRAGEDPEVTSPEPPILRPARPMAPDPTTTVQVADGVRIVSAPVLAHDFLVPGTRIVRPGLDHAVAFIGGTEVGPLLALARQPVPAGRLIERWGAHLDRDRAIAIFESLWAHDLLRAVDGC
jgi:flavin-dependent dehydrogenase